MTLSPVLLALATAASGAAAAPHAAPPKVVATAPAEIDAVLDSDSYGYTLTCVVNGHDLGITGGKSESQREFSETSKDAGDFAPAERGKYQALHYGRNTVAITYRRKVANEAFDMNVSLKVLGYPAPLFYAHVVSAGAGKFEGAFDIDAKPSKAFRPLYFSEGPAGTTGFLYIEQTPAAHSVFSPELNGGLLQQQIDVPSASIPFASLHPGANKLSVEYKTHGGPIRLFIAGPTAVSFHVIESEKKTTRTFVIQGGSGKVPGRSRAAYPARSERS